MDKSFLIRYLLESAGLDEKQMAEFGQVFVEQLAQRVAELVVERLKQDVAAELGPAEGE